MAPWILALGATVGSAYTFGLDKARTLRAVGVVTKEQIAAEIRPRLDGLDPQVHGRSIIRSAERDALALLLGGIIDNVVEAEAAHREHK